MNLALKQFVDWPVEENDVKDEKGKNRSSYSSSSTNSLESFLPTARTDTTQKFYREMMTKLLSLTS